MPDEIIQSVKVDTKDAVESLENLGTEYQKAGKSAQDAGERFAFTNEELMAETEKYNQIAEKSTAINKELANAKKSVGSATEQNTRALAENTAVTREANVQGTALLGTMSKQRIAFQDFGRILTGQGFSLRSISSNFALLGPAVTIAAVAVGALGYEVYKSYTYYKDLNDITKQYGKTLAESAPAQAETIVNVQKMNDLFSEAQAGLVSRTDVLNEYNKQFGDSIGKAKTYNQAEQLFIDRSPDYVQAMEQRAIATAAYKLEQEALTDKIKSATEQGLNGWQKTDLFFTRVFQGAQKAQNLSNAMLGKNREDAQTLVDEYSKIGKAAEDAAASIDKASGIDTLGKGKDSKKQKNDESLAEQKRYVEESQKIEEDAEQKAVETEQIKYEKIKSDLEKAGHATEELTRQHEANIDAIHNEFAEKRFEKAQADHAKRQQEIKDQQLKAEQHLQEIENQISAHYNKDQNIEVSARQKALNEANAFYEKEKAALAGHEKELEALEKQHKQELAAINKDFDDKQFAQEATADAKELKRISELTARDDRNRIVQLQKKKHDLDTARDMLDTFYDEGVISSEQYTQKVEALSKARTQITLEELSAYAGYADQVGGSLNKIGAALGKSTQAGKEFAIAGATIDAISSAVKAYNSMAGIPVVGPALGAAAAAAALLAGYDNVKKIAATKVPGQGGSSGSGAGSSSYSNGSPGGGGSAPSLGGGNGRAIQIAPQSISQMNNSRSGGTEPVQAFVVESQVTGSQQRAAGYRNAASI
jgi:hypothetical protein